MLKSDAGELAVRQAVGEVAAVVEFDFDIGHRGRAQADVRGVGLVHAQHHVGVLAAGVALRGGAVQIAGQGQVGGDLPLAVDAVEVGVDDAIFGLCSAARD